jgi:hypothetical protein
VEVEKTPVASDSAGVVPVVSVAHSETSSPLLQFPGAFVDMSGIPPAVDLPSNKPVSMDALKSMWGDEFKVSTLQECSMRSCEGSMQVLTVFVFLADDGYGHKLAGQA